jgi:TP901 family phage tail tape measure protein
MQRVGQRAAVAGGAILAPLAGSVNEATKVQDRLAQLRATGAVSQEQATRARKEAIKFTRQHTDTIGDFLDTQRRMVSAGLDSEEALQGTRAALQTATATFAENAETGELLATVYNNLGDESADVETEMQRLSDVLVATQKNFQLRDLNQLTESFKEGAPAAVQFGLSVEEASVALGALNTAGLQGSRAGTALARMMDNLESASSELGFQVAETAEGNVDLAATMQNLEKRFGSISDLAPATRESLRSAFGVRGFRGLTLLLEQMDNFEDGLASIEEGVAEEAADEVESTLSASFQRLRNNLQAFGASAGRHLLTPLQKVVDLLSRGIGAVTRLAEVFPGLTAVVTGVAGAIGSLLVVGGGLVTTLGLLAQGVASGIQGFLALGSTLTTLRMGYLRAVVAARSYAVSQGAASVASLSGAGSIKILSSAAWASVPSFQAATAGVASFTTALLTNPITGAAVAIATAGVLIYQHWDRIKAFFAGLWEGVRPGLEPLMGLLRSMKRIGAFLFDPLLDAIAPAVNAFQRLFAPAEATKEELKSARLAGKRMGEALQIAFAPINRVVHRVELRVRALWTLLQNVAEWAATTELLPDIVQSGAALFSGVSEQIGNVAAGRPPGGFTSEEMPEGGPLSEEARREQNAPQRGVTNVAVQPDSLLRGGVTPERAEESGRGTARGFARGLREGEAEVENAMGQVMGSARAFMPDSPAERGPLSDLGRTGPAMMETMAAGISGRPVESALSDALGTLPNEVEAAPELRSPASTPTVEEQVVPIRPELRGPVPTPAVEEQTLGILPEIRGAVPAPSPEDQTASIQPEIQGPVPSSSVGEQIAPIRPQLRGPVPTPDVEEQAASIRPEVEGSPSLPTVSDQTMGILPQFQGAVPTPGIEEQAAPIRPEMRGAVPSVPSVPDQVMGIRPELREAVPSVETGEQRLPLRPGLEGAVPTPEPASTQAPAERAVREVVGVSKEKSGPEAKRPIEITNNFSIELDVQGDVDESEVGDEVRRGVSEGTEDLERRMRRVLEEERRTGF